MDRPASPGRAMAGSALVMSTLRTFWSNREANSVTCPGIQETRLPDNRLQVAAHLRNRENRRIQVQIQCVFKDEQRVSTGDETAWQTLILAENSTEAVRFTAMNPQAKTYEIRVRQAR